MNRVVHEKGFVEFFPSAGGNPPESQTVDEYQNILLAFGPADHTYELENEEDYGAYVLGYN